MHKLMPISISPKNDGLNQHQKCFIYATTKYLTLLSIAVLSIVTNILFLVIRNIAYNDRTQFALSFNLDLTVNIICLYLQYSFFKECYDKYCTCFGK